jgi:hypothetical protein
MARAAALALPEVVIALSRGAQTFQPIRRFTMGLAALLTLAMGLFAFSPAADFYIFVVQDMTAVVGNLAQSTLAFFLFFPALATITSWLRGLLINGRATKEVNVGMAINLVITGAILGIGLANKLPGLPTAAAAFNIAAACEIIYLAWRSQRVLAIRWPIFSFRRLEIGN